MKHIILALLTTITLPIVAQTNVAVTYTVTSKDRLRTINDVKSKKENQPFGDVVSMLDEGTRKTYLLVTNGQNSSFTPVKQEEQLAEKKPKIIIISNDYVDEESSVYKHFQTRKVVEAIDFLMKTFTITDSIQKLPWQLQTKEKEILGQKCNYATIGDSIKAWYCMSLPINDGPGRYYGLPGLILDLETPEAVYECQSIDTQSDKEIENDKNGKAMTRPAFEAFKADAYKKLKNR